MRNRILQTLSTFTQTYKFACRSIQSFLSSSSVSLQYEKFGEMEGEQAFQSILRKSLLVTLPFCWVAFRFGFKGLNRNHVRNSSRCLSPPLWASLCVRESCAYRHNNIFQPLCTGECILNYNVFFSSCHSIALMCRCIVLYLYMLVSQHQYLPCCLTHLLLSTISL